MAFMKQALTESDVKKLTVAGVKKAYIELAKDYNKLLEQDVILCPKCNKFKARSNFYQNKNYDAGFFPICKECLLQMATDKNKDGTYKDNKEKAKNTLRIMDLPFIESVYDNAINDVTNAVNEKNRGTAWQQWMVMLSSLPNWKGKTWKDSEFKDNSEYDDEYEVKENQKIIKKAKKRFGMGSSLSNEDYIFLWNEFEDWLAKYECNTKAQESIFERLAFKKLEIMKATKNGQPTKDLDRTYQDLLGSINILPRQQSSNGLSDSLTFGQLIEKWEAEEPIPRPDPELEDVDNIGKKLRVFFSGHLSKALGLNTSYSKEYDEYMSQYTVQKPEYNGVEENKDKNIYTKLFGSDGSE